MSETVGMTVGMTVIETMVDTGIVKIVAEAEAAVVNEDVAALRHVDLVEAAHLHQSNVQASRHRLFVVALRKRNQYATPKGLLLTH
jgi:hypothetical protein